MTAPSFSSFPPIFNSFPDLDPPSTSKRHDSPDSPQREDKAPKRSKDEKSRSDRKGRKKEKGGHGAKHRRQNSRERHLTSRSKPEIKGSVEDDVRSSILEGQSKLFYQDNKGDTLNVTYGGVHSGDIPKYYPVRRGRNILGLENGHVVRREGQGVFVDVGGGGKTRSAQLSDARTRKLLASPLVHRFDQSAKVDAFYDEVEGFIRVARISHKSAQSDPPYWSVTQDIEDSSESSNDDDDKSDYSDVDSDASPLSAREETLRRLEQTIKEDPSSVTSWLALLENSRSGIPSTSKNANKAVQEITLSVLSRAIKAHPANDSSVLLRLKLLKAGEDIWDEAKLGSEWETTLRCVNTADVWVEWLDWRMRRGTGGIDGCLDDARRALTYASNVKDSWVSDAAMLRMFWRSATFLRQSGFLERSTALFQAQAELSFMTPNRMRDLTLDKQLDSLEEFWESEVPRIGELSSEGWRSWSIDTETATFPPSIARQPSSAESDPYMRWASGESEVTQKRHLPLRSTDDDGGDPYATILFSDIRPLLVGLKTSKGRERFRLIWLHFLGLRIPGLIATLSPLSLDEKWAEENCVGSSILPSLVPERNAHDVVTSDSFAGISVGREKVYRSSFAPVRQWGLDVVEPLEGVQLNGEGRLWSSFEGDSEFIRNIFKQLRKEGDESWDLLSLSFEASIGLKTALKASKSFLANNQSSLALWAAHARLERLRGRFDDARKIYETVFSSLRSFMGDPVTVFFDYAEMEWLLGKPDDALNIILRSSGQQDGNKGGLQILRAKRHLEEASLNTHTSANWKCRMKWLRLRIVLELLSGTVQAAVEVIESRIAQEQSGSGVHEHLVVHSLLLVYHHIVTLKSPAPRSILRDMVAKFIDVYPENTMILGVFLECEKGEGVWGRVRGHLSERSLTQLGGKSLVRRIIEVWVTGWERRRWEAEVERIKAGLETATTSDDTKSSPIIWRILLEVEIKAGMLDKAKRLLFRALGECPMVKELYLLAFGPLREVFSTRELNSLADTMAERGLRLRTSLDDMFDGQRVTRDQEDEINIEDEPVDELEERSKEIRRLMPY